MLPCQGNSHSHRVLSTYYVRVYGARAWAPPHQAGWPLLGFLPDTGVVQRKAVTIVIWSQNSLESEHPGRLRVHQSLPWVTVFGQPSPHRKGSRNICWMSDSMMEEINERPNVGECLLLDGGRLKKKKKPQEFLNIMLNEISQIQMFCVMTFVWSSRMDRIHLWW